MAYLISKEPSYYSSLLINEINLLEKQFFEPIFLLINQMIVLVVTLYTLMVISPYITLFILVIGLLPILLPKMFMGKLRNKVAKYNASMQSYTMSLNEIISGYEVFKTYNAQDKAINKHMDSNDQMALNKRDAFRFIDIVSMVGNISALIVVFSSLLVAMYLGISGFLTIGQVFTISFLSGNILGPLSGISSLLPKIKGCDDYIEKHIYVKSDKKFKIPSNPIKNNISFKNVILTLGNKEILKDISLDFEIGKKYLIVGGSGSGKSTILKLLLKFFSMYTGDISIDGEDFKTLDSKYIYDNISYVPQKPVFFDGSIKENTTLFETIEDEDIDFALSFSEIENRVYELEGGKEYKTDRNSSSFSGGEKQRLSLARGILNKKKIILLDESTSALDINTFEKIEKKLLSSELTIISIAHRLNKEIIENYDKIYVLNHGRLVGEGRFKELIRNHSYFKELYFSANKK